MERTNQRDFTKKSIIDFLNEKSICGCVNTTGLSESLGTISPRMLRNYVIAGKLQPIEKNTRFYVFKVEDVADWLLQYPQYLFKRTVDNSDMTNERINELSQYIRDFTKKRWPAILKYMDLEDVVMETMAIILRKRRTKDVSDSTMVFRALYTLYQKVSKRIDTVLVDPNTIEQTYEGNDNE